MNVYEWKALGSTDIMPGVAGTNIAGRKLMLCRFRYAPNFVEPVHSHESEQISWVIEGRVRFASDGREIECGPGDVVHFPSHQPHGMQVLAEPAELIEIFSPVRQDLIAAMSRQFAQTAEPRA